MATTKVTATHVIIDVPGKFDSFFSGSGVGQGQVSMEQSGDLGAPGLYKAYCESERIIRGKGYSLRFIVPRDDLTLEVLGCLRDYGDTCYHANRDNATGVGLDPEDRNSAYGEMMAGSIVVERVDAVLKMLDESK